MSLSHTTARRADFNSDFVSRVVGRVSGYLASVRAERQLQSLDDRMLHDIGIARSDIQRLVRGL
jgi:uncharacterized protein YjiS (DUF1127 family)